MRISIPEVKALLQDDTADVILQIQTANQIVDEYLISSGLSANMLKQIEMFLAAHIWQLGQGGDITSESYGPNRFQYAIEACKGLGSTKWGQQALVLDVTGSLMNLNTPRIAFEVF